MKRSALALVALLVPGLAFGGSVTWNLDKNHSTVGFVARHLGFAKVTGHFKEFKVTRLEADPKTGNLVSLEAEADAKSVDTGIEKRDAHLRSDDFFNAEKFPRLTLKVKSIKWKGDKFEAVAALTIRGHTKDVTLTGKKLGFQKVNFGQGPQLRTAYEAMATINRKEFGLKFNGLAEGISVVADNVDLVLEASFWTPAVASAAGKK